MDDQNTNHRLAGTQRRRSRNYTGVPVTCPGCGAERQMRIWEWRKRKSDYCHPCGCRIRVGLLPTGESGKGTSLHSRWSGMRRRCRFRGNGNASDMANYAARGIRVCEEWARSFEAFKLWAEANGYHEGLVLDRIDNERGYEPSNCRWVGMTASNRNRRCVKLSVEQADEIRARLVGGKRGIQRQLAREFGVSEAAISFLKSGSTWA